MNLVRRSFRRRSTNIEMMKMVEWCPRLAHTYYFDDDQGRALSHTYNNKSSTR
jgi:hypothetical protein